MKTVILLSACILLAIVVENAQGSPVNDRNARHSGGGSGGNGGGNRAPKPGSCYRPVNGRKRRAVDEDVDMFEDDFQHVIEKRQVGNNGGGSGGNPWRPTRPTQPPRPLCNNDYQCTGNQKCCSGNCQAPAFVG